MELVLYNTNGVNGRFQCSDSSGIPRWQAVLDVVEGGVNEEVRCGAIRRRRAVPSSTLYADVVGNTAELFELTVGDDNAVFADNGDLRSIGTPNNGFDLGSAELSEDASRLDLE